MTASDKLLVAAWAAVAALDLGVDGSNFHEESVLLLFLRAAGTLPPDIVAGRGNLQRFTEQADGPLSLVVVDEAVGQVAFLAKNAAAFFLGRQNRLE